MDESKTSALFFSQCLLSKNGALASIWIAAFCLKRLKKLQVTHFCIPSSVDKIIQEGFSCVTYRVLAYLLIGVVRIYSKKVDYLLEDAIRVNKLKVSEEITPFKDVVHRSHSIILPKSYELDAFQLEVDEDIGSGHDARDEDITLQDARKDTFKQIRGKMHFGELSSLHDESLECDMSPSAGTTLRHEISSYTQTPNKVTSDEENSMGASTPPNKVLSPHQVQIGTEISSQDHAKYHQTSREKLRQLQNEFMDVDTFCGVDIELLKLVEGYESQKIDAGDEDDIQEAVCNNYDHDHVKMQEEVSPPMEKTPESEAADATPDAHCCEIGNDNPDDNTPKFLVVSTPAKKETNPRPHKRKCIIDGSTQLANEVMRQTIKDASDLVRKRRKVCHSMMDVWMVSHLPPLHKNFSKPLILCAALVPQHIRCVLTTETSTPRNMDIETIEATKPPEMTSPRTSTIIAPGTPARGPTSARFFASSEPGDSEGEGPIPSCENIRKDFSLLEDNNVVGKMGDNEGDNQELHKNKSGLSARTRTVARYLHEVLHKRKQLGEDSITLHPILARKTRAETARFFYEILVLSTSGLMNAKQEKAYDDISLRETVKMEATMLVS